MDALMIADLLFIKILDFEIGNKTFNLNIQNMVHGKYSKKESPAQLLIYV